MMFSQQLNTHKKCKRLAKALIRQRVCWSHTPHCLKSHVTPHLYSVLTLRLCFAFRGSHSGDPVIISSVRIDARCRNDCPVLSKQTMVTSNFPLLPTTFLGHFVIILVGIASDASSF